MVKSTTTAVPKTKHQPVTVKSRKEARTNGVTSQNTKASPQTNKQTAKVTPAAATVSDAPAAPNGRLAKAGKRSAKGIRETAEKQKSGRPDGKPTAASTRRSKTGLPSVRKDRRGKKYRDSLALIERGRLYSIEEAATLAKKTNPAGFDATVELHFHLNLDAKQTDHNIRGSLLLPAGSGRQPVVAVFAEGQAAIDAKAEGADLVAIDELLLELEAGRTPFDVLLTTPSFMSKLAKYARLLGPKGLMPSPRSGTVHNDLKQAVREIKAGRIEYRLDSSSNIHLAIGKASFRASDLVANTSAVIDNIKTKRPAGLKGSYILSAHLTTTMGPSIGLAVGG